jgi:para-aminobenzoate synthetase component 1
MTRVAARPPHAGARVLPWRDPLIAFAPLSDLPSALLLHDGEHGRARIFAFPERVHEGDDRASFDRLIADFRNGSNDCVHAGLFGYDLANAFERLPVLDVRWPGLVVGRYPAWAEFDREAGTLTIEGRDAEAVDRLARALGNADLVAPTDRDPTASWRPRWSRDQYLEKARQARDYVHAGDVFQVNLSQAFDLELALDDTPWQAFRRLCQQSPAPHAAYFRIDDERVVLTNSPERFLSMHDRCVETRPIKGTRPRSDDPAEDAALALELAASAKDRAENLMIVDLMRNDLSRVCDPGSITVPALCDIETYANVHHLVSVVEGKLACGHDGFDLIAASFPPGSITGAPKVRAMEIISELENEPRGPYCGALGWIDGQGGLDLNVMIRTVSLRLDGQAWVGSVRSGGGIVADSDPAAEYDETLAKASALRRALGVAQ